jgi:hypothetical protein
VSWIKVGEHWNFLAQVPAGIKTRLRLPVGPDRFTATLDDKKITSTQKGRWLEIPLVGGMHSGTWTSLN